MARNAYSRGEPEHGAELADDLERLVALHDASTIAAVIVEPVACSAGVLIPPKGYLTRLAAICAPAQEREELLRCLRDTVALERAAISGRLGADPEIEGLVEDLGSSLRAILRDVLCGHLDPSLRTLADSILAETAGEPSLP